LDKTKNSQNLEEKVGILEDLVEEPEEVETSQDKKVVQKVKNQEEQRNQQEKKELQKQVVKNLKKKVEKI
jgi:hypothetical protein